MRFVLASIALLSLGCGASTGAPSDLGGTAADLAGVDLRWIPPDMTFHYPPGPYGNQVGDVLKDLIGDGYPMPDASPTAMPYQQVRLSRFVAEQECSCVLIAQVALWADTSWKLANRVGGNDKGLCLFIIVDEGRQGVPATADDVKAWWDEFHFSPAVIGNLSNRASLPEVQDHPAMTTVAVPSMKLKLHRVGLFNDPVNDALTACDLP